MEKCQLSPFSQKQRLSYVVRQKNRKEKKKESGKASTRGAYGRESHLSFFPPSVPAVAAKT